MDTSRLEKAQASFADKNVLVLGGMGFVGSSLALRLAACGARVTVVDAMIEEYGGNPFNVRDIRDQVRVNYADIRDEHAMSWLVRGQDVVFHSAAQVCHLKSLSDPFPDIDINIRGTTVVMEALRQHNPAAKVIKLGSRGQYGSVLELPAREDAKPEPKGIYEISLLAAEHILAAYWRNHAIPCVLTRLTNIYGPRAQMRHNRFGVANWFVRLALDDQTIPVFGSGLIKRDFLYIDDCVDALMLLAAEDSAVGQVYNVGHDRPSNFLEMAGVIVDCAKTGRIEHTPFSAERQAQEPGDFYTDIAKVHAATGWRPATPLREGVARTVDFYRNNKEHYW